MPDFTHHVALVLDNDQGLYNERLRLVAAALEDEYPNATLQESLKDLVEELAYADWASGDEDGDHLSMMARELLGCAMSAVDWFALAAGYLAEHAVQS